MSTVSQDKGADMNAARAAIDRAEKALREVVAL
jgi:hypothetical protein